MTDPRAIELLLRANQHRIQAARELEEMTVALRQLEELLKKSLSAAAEKLAEEISS